MLARIRRQATFANVVAVLALIVAVAGGSAYALQGRNTVFSDDIAPDEVRGADAKEKSFKIPRVIVEEISSASTVSGDLLAAYVYCPKGYSVTGGGFSKSDSNIKLQHNTPYTDDTNYDGWAVIGESTAGGQTVTAKAVCQRGRTLQAAG